MIGPIIVIVGLILLIGGFLYWQLVIVEGVYFGQGIVTLLYDLTAGRYDHIKAYQPAMEDLYLGQPLAEMLSDLGRPAVLDIGTGTGRLPLALFEQASFTGEVIGIDASRRMLVEAKRKMDTNGVSCLLIWKNAATLPFPEETFDTVTCLEMSEFTRDPIGQLREGIRVLKPGGIFLTSRRRGMDARLMPGKTFSAEEFERILLSLELRDVRIEPWQVDYDLVWAQKSGVLSNEPLMDRSQIQCMVCDQLTLNWQPAKVVCTYCKAGYDFEDGIMAMQQGEKSKKS